MEFKKTDIGFIKLFGNDRKVIDLKTINEEMIEKIAESLLMNYVLVVNDKEFRICEIEFYIKSTSHNDQYTHGDKNQKLFGKWYFHRYANGSYKSGTYKGLDITMGNEETCFGVLIRSIYDNENNVMIEGPCRCVNKILELNNVSDVKEYMIARKDPLMVDHKENFYLKEDLKLTKEQIYKGARIGLSDKYPNWKNIPYRFLIKKNQIKKGKSDLVALKKLNQIL